MSKRSDRIRKIASLAESEERLQCQQMGKSQQQLDEQIERLEELETYRQNYMERPQPSNSVPTAHWNDYQNFLQRLDQAVVAQQQIVAQGRRNCDLHRHRWQVKRQRLDSLERVVDRYHREEQELHERRSQQAIDDRPGNGNSFDDR